MGSHSSVCICNHCFQRRLGVLGDYHSSYSTLLEKEEKSPPQPPVQGYFCLAGGRRQRKTCDGAAATSPPLCQGASSSSSFLQHLQDRLVPAFRRPTVPTSRMPWQNLTQNPMTRCSDVLITAVLYFQKKHLQSPGKLSVGAFVSFFTHLWPFSQTPRGPAQKAGTHASCSLTGACALCRAPPHDLQNHDRPSSKDTRQPTNSNIPVLS